MRDKLPQEEPDHPSLRELHRLAGANIYVCLERKLAIMLKRLLQAQPH